MLLGTFIVILVVVFIISYKKAKPDEALIISGMGKKRSIVGKAGFAIPFLQRVDRVSMKLMQIDVKAYKIPTVEYININVDAVANVQIPNEPTAINIASQNFLNLGEEQIKSMVKEVLEGNTREIVGQIPLKDLVNKRETFNAKVQEAVVDDLAKIGLVIVNFNVQSFTDDNHAIEDLGIDNLAQIKKNAQIAKARAEREVQVETAKAKQEGNKEQAENEKLIAEQNQELAVKQAEAKKIAQTAEAEAEKAFAIADQVQQKTLNENEMIAKTAQAEKELELKERQIALMEKQLDAEIKKKADAERYAIEQTAEANKQKAIAEAEAKKQAMLKQAEGIKAIGIAEAEAIKAKKLAEAEGVEKLALAQAKMQHASIIDMVVQKLPDIAKEIASPLNQVDSITLYDPQGTTKLVESGTRNMEQVLQVAKQCGIDLPDLINNFVKKPNTSDTSKSSAKKSSPEGNC